MPTSRSLSTLLAPLALVLGALLSGCAATDAGTAVRDDLAGAEQSAAAYQRLRTLDGTWTNADPEGGMAMSITYRTTAAGHTVEEVLNPGAPHEMVTMYHLDGPHLILTHYCAAGNQPTMVLLADSGPDVLHFDFLRGSNMTPTDGHMHRAVIDLSQDNQLTATWTFFNEGVAGDDIVVKTQRSE